MITDPQKCKTYYQALIDRDANYDGIFYAGITTTGIFCHATCTARKPKIENCLFFATAESALLAGFRPCKRCHPLSYPREISPLIKEIVKQVESNPEKRWQDQDFEALGIHSATARRQFKKLFGMTFVQYARSRRMGLALKSIRSGEKIINAQLDVGYESSSSFYDAFSKIMHSPPQKHQNIVTLCADWVDTLLGPMMSISDENYLYLLEFVNRRGLEREIERLRNNLNAAIIPGKTTISHMIKKELNDYFLGKNLYFTTPIFYIGSEFQKRVWNALRNIDIGTTTNYQALGQQISHKKASRAVGNANGANQLAIIIPCHRVIQSNGSLGGYGGGLERKSWLLQHEKSYAGLDEVD